MRVLFIGGTGEISFACVEAAKRAGHAVTLFNRGKAFDAARLGVEQWVGDFADDASYAGLAQGGFDVVCQFLAFDTKAVERDIETFGGQCGHYIFISTASAYQKPSQTARITEDTPLDNPFWAYSRSKADCEARLLEAHLAGHLPVTLVRPSHTYRTRIPSVVITGDHLAWRLLRGKPVIVPGDGESLWTVTHSEDFARAFIQLFGHDQALGQAFHITDDIGHSWNRLLRAAAHQVGTGIDIRPVLTKTLLAYDPNWEGPLLGDKSNSKIFDNRKIADLTGGWQCEISLEQGIAKTWPRVAERLNNGFAPDPKLDALIDQIIAEQS